MEPWAGDVATNDCAARLYTSSGWILEIISDTRRSSVTSPRCRYPKATILRIEEMDGFISKVKSIPSDFNEYRWNKCSTGIHFFYE